MGLVKLRIRELAKERGWSLREVATRAEVPYTTVTTYARSTGMAMADISAVMKIAQVFETSIEELVEVVEE
ncbi:MAG: helix-turn-helix transcriptional regulator [Cyanobacteria bacterium P01_D01_bin.44]